MNTTIGTGQQAITIVTNAVTTAEMCYFTRFVSEPFASSQTSISANTWQYNFATTQESIAANFPTLTGPNSVDICVYVWRPGTGKVGNILDGTTAATVMEPAALTEASHHVDFTGAAVASTQAGDVIICEIWFDIDQNTATARNDDFWFDGTTVTTTENTTVSNHASFIETPQTLAFASQTITMTEVAALTYSNKFITKV